MVETRNCCLVHIYTPGPRFADGWGGGGDGWGGGGRKIEPHHDGEGLRYTHVPTTHHLVEKKKIRKCGDSDSTHLSVNGSGFESDFTEKSRTQNGRRIRGIALTNRSIFFEKNVFKT